MSKSEVAVEVVSGLISAINGGRTDWDAVATEIGSDHPTLIGRVAKAVGVGIMRRTSREPDWKPFGFFIASPCPDSGHVIDMWGGRYELPVHPDHDGRLDCTTVVGAELMSRQSFI
jgi:hypothetical protein